MVGRWNLNSLILHGCTLNVSSFLAVLFILPSQPLTDRHPTNLSHSVITHEQVWLYLSDQLAWPQKLCPGGWGERRRGRYKWWSDVVRKSQVYLGEDVNWQPPKIGDKPIPCGKNIASPLMETLQVTLAFTLLQCAKPRWRHYGKKSCRPLRVSDQGTPCAFGILASCLPETQICCETISFLDEAVDVFRCGLRALRYKRDMDIFHKSSF